MLSLACLLWEQTRVVQWEAWHRGSRSWRDWSDKRCSSWSTAGSLHMWLHLRGGDEGCVCLLSEHLPELEGGRWRACMCMRLCICMELRWGNWCCVSSYRSPVTPGCSRSYHHKGPFCLDKNKQPSMQKLDFPPASRSGWGAGEISGVIRFHFTFFFFRFTSSVWVEAPFLRTFTHNLFSWVTVPVAEVCYSAPAGSIRPGMGASDRRPGWVKITHCLHHLYLSCFTHSSNMSLCSVSWVFLLFELKRCLFSYLQNDHFPAN